MNFQLSVRQFACAFLLAAISGCTPLAVPQNGSGTITIIEGGLVETMVFDGGTTLNIQITQEDVSEYDYLDQHILTIGEFSPIIGSGFTKRSNIYYESPIDFGGNDIFMVGKEKFRVFWKETDVITRSRNPASVFSVTIDQVSF